MDRWPWLLPVLAFLIPTRRPPAIAGADLPGSAITHALASVSGLVSEERVSGLGIISVSSKQGVSPVRFPQFSLAHRGSSTSDNTALWTASRPTRTPRQEYHHQRAHSQAGRTKSWQIRLRQIGRGAAENLFFLFEPTVSFTKFSKLLGLSFGSHWFLYGFDSLLTEPLIQCPTWIPKSFAIILTVTPGSRAATTPKDILTEDLWARSRQTTSSQANKNQPSQTSPTRATAPLGFCPSWLVVSACWRTRWRWIRLWNTTVRFIPTFVGSQWRVHRPCWNCGRF